MWSLLVHLGFTFLGLGEVDAVLSSSSCNLLLSFLLLFNMLEKIGSVKVFITLESEYGAGFLGEFCWFFAAFLW